MLRAQAKQAEGVGEADARRSVELEDREAVVAAAGAERQAQQDAMEQAQGMSTEEAKRSIDLEDREAAVSAKEAEEAQRQQAAAQALQAQNTADARRRADIAEFQKTFPDAAKDPKSIPAEVWADVRNGSTLVAAYAKYTVAQAKAAQQAAEQRAESTAQNQKNAVRSTGSMKSAGENLNSKDPFLEGWGD